MRLEWDRVMIGAFFPIEAFTRSGKTSARSQGWEDRNWSSGVTGVEGFSLPQFGILKVYTITVKTN